MILFIYLSLFLLGNCVRTTIDDASANSASRMNDGATSSGTVDECVICLEELTKNAIHVCQRNDTCPEKASGCGMRLHEECIQK